MRMVTIVLEQRELAGVVTLDGVVPVERINQLLGKSWETDLLLLIR